MDDDDVDIGGFMPSSMSGGGTRRQTARPKRVRNVSQHSASSVPSVSALDELDSLMGLIGTDKLSRPSTAQIDHSDMARDDEKTSVALSMSDHNESARPPPAPSSNLTSKYNTGYVDMSNMPDSPKSEKSSPYSPRDKKEDHDYSPNTFSRQQRIAKPTESKRRFSGGNLEVSFDSSDDGAAGIAGNSNSLRFSPPAKSVSALKAPKSPKSPKDLHINTSATPGGKSKVSILSPLSSTNDSPSVSANRRNSLSDTINRSATAVLSSPNSQQQHAFSFNTASNAKNASTDTFAASYRDRKRMELEQDVLPVSVSNPKSSSSAGYQSPSQTPRYNNHQHQSSSTAESGLGTSNHSDEIALKLYKTIELLEQQLKQQQSLSAAAATATASASVSFHELEMLKYKLSSAEKEIESLKQQLHSMHELQAKNKLNETIVAEQKAEIARLTADKDDYKSKYLEFELDNKLLKEDMVQQSLKNSEILTYNNAKRNLELKEAELKYENEIKSLEKRHENMIEGIKKLHVDEIENIKERMKYTINLENMSNQIKSTSGSIKLIEEQLNARYRGVEASRQGQMEARERLLSEMEERAKERNEVAETETFRLKGMLVHMEGVVQNLRAQSADEKERLRLEHNRLQSLQSSLETERAAFHKHMTEETDLSRQKQREVSDEKMRWYQEKHKQVTDLENLKAKLESEKTEISNKFISQQSTLSLDLERLKNEKVELEKLRNTVMAESQVFEAKKYEIIKQQSDLDTYQSSINILNEKTVKEKLQLDKVAYELKLASENLQHEISLVNRREQELNDKEQAIAKRIKEHEVSQSQLLLKEQEVQGMYRTIEAKLINIENEESKLYEKKLAIASAHRELLTFKGQFSSERFNTRADSSSTSAAATMRQSWSGPLSSSYTAYTHDNAQSRGRGNDESFRGNDMMSAMNNRNLVRGFQSSPAPGASATSGRMMPPQTVVYGNMSQQMPADDSYSMLSTTQTMLNERTNDNIENALNSRLHRIQGVQQSNNGQQSWMQQFESSLSKTKGADVLKKYQAKPGSETYEIEAARVVLREANHVLRGSAQPSLSHTSMQ